MGITCYATVGLVVMLAGITAVAEIAAQATDDIGNLIDGSEIDLSFRYRYEYVDQSGFANEAKASTVLSRLSLQSGSYRNIDFFVEVDDVHEVAVDDFNAGAGNTPNRTQYPVVADPPRVREVRRRDRRP